MTIFFRLLGNDDKGTALHQAIQQLAQKQPNPITFTVEAESFRQIPGSSLAYWMSSSTRHHIMSLEPLEFQNVSCRIGLGTLEDFRFLRLKWEVFDTSKWITFAKGGRYAPY